MNRSFSGLYPSTSPARVTLPGACVPAAIAPGVTETRKPPDHDCITVMLNQFCCVAQNTGEWLRVTRKRSVHSTMDVSGRYVISCQISNEDLYKKTNCPIVVLEIKRRWLRCLGHVLRMDQDRMPEVALR